MDDFAKAAAEGWESLTNLLSSLSIDEKEKSSLLDRIENSCLYLKTSYSLRCTNNNECPTHCTVFALSQATSQEFRETCKHKHDNYCAGMNPYLSNNGRTHHSYSTQNSN